MGMDQRSRACMTRMNRSTKQTLSDLRWYLVNGMHWLRNRKHQDHAEGPLVLVDIRDNVWHRYLHILLLFLHSSGSVVHIRHRYRFIGSWASHDLFSRSAFFRIVFRPLAPDAYQLVLTDRPMDGPHVLLDPDYFDLPEAPREGMRLPMSMADTFYIQGLHMRSDPDPEHPRERCLFFFGNMDRAAYDRPEPRIAFGCFTRTALFDLLKDGYKERIFEPSRLSEVALRGKRDIVLLGRQCEYIPPARLLQVLSRFDLFLAPSGVVMPLCHNVVEAMAAGCIPVLQYPHLMEPPLEHGINCLAYDNAEQLHTVLERFPDISATEVVAMRRHVLAYYKEHLAPEAVVEKLRTLAGKQARLRVNAEMLSTQLLFEQRTDQDRTVMAGQ
jgi:glycosyltransferase involved in cell wall biosynthesis